MFHLPGYMENVSLWLSQVLADIGVNERIVMKRRRAFQLDESLWAIYTQLLENGYQCSISCFGSQSESTTTLGLESDFDVVILAKSFNVIQDWSDWEPGLRNYLMIQDETVSPGYCLLQHVCDDVPLSFDFVPNECHIRDRTGRVLLNNNCFEQTVASCLGEGARHGPAHSVQGPSDYFSDTDLVLAFPCTTWPQQARLWLDHQGEGQIISDDMREYCRRSGCFVVGVGSKGSENEDLEWRISTSLAERCLMFNLNITQIQCYVLMKMILKDFIHPLFKDNISSFMSKCILLHCIYHTNASVWRENRLLECFSLCLVVLYNSILNENCPHVFIPENNLMRGHISPADKPYILDILRKIILSEGRALLELQCDDLGYRLRVKLQNGVSLFTRNEKISGQLMINTLIIIKDVLYYLFSRLSHGCCDVLIVTLHKYIMHFANIMNQYNGLEKKACCLLLPWLNTTLGSTLASLSIQQNNAISAEAFTWISVGLKTDVAYSKLKLASMFFCSGDTQRAETVLMDIERNYEINCVEPVCVCHEYGREGERIGFFEICDNHNEEAIHITTASCVIFLPCEINCIPTELQHEMFRSTQDDHAFRRKLDLWMDWAMVDSLPYLYFLQYKIYKLLGRQDLKEVALSKLTRTIDQEQNLGHRETALNLLGQCMEQEDRARDALRCYSLSLGVRDRNNAAKLHICMILTKMMQNR